MKRFLFSLVAILFTCVCFAQDVIIKKDGTTILSTVIKVGQSEVEYKKYNNQTGPTYTISIKDLSAINYANGTKDTFAPTYNNQGIFTSETATQFSNDEGLMKLFDAANDTYRKKAKRIRTIGWIVGGTLVAAGGVLIGIYFEDTCCNEGYLPAGAAVVGAGLITWTTCTLVGNHIGKKSKYSVQSNPLFQQEYKIGKNSLAFGVDMLNDNTFKNQTLGLGVSYKF